MSIGPLQALIHRLRETAPSAAPADGELLRRWTAARDEAAFELLVWRHGRLVLSVCRRLLRDHGDVEDAFQATFLLLVRKAGSIRGGQALGAWLHTVATRAALAARKHALRRPSSEGLEQVAAPAVRGQDELLAVLDQEVAQLPEKFRAAFVLCVLSGMTTEQAAGQLGCPVGTVASRLARARQRLRERFLERGLAPGTLLPFLEDGALSALLPSLPVGLPAATVNAAVALAAGRVAASALAPSAVALMTEVLQTMFVSKLKLAGLAVMTVVLLGLGGLAGVQGQGPAKDRPLTPEQKLARARADVEAAKLALSRLEAEVTLDRYAYSRAYTDFVQAHLATTDAAGLEAQKAKVATADAQLKAAKAVLAAARARRDAAEAEVKRGPRSKTAAANLELARIVLTRCETDVNAAEATHRLEVLLLEELAKKRTAALRTATYYSRLREAVKPPPLEKRVEELEKAVKSLQAELERLRKGGPGWEKRKAPTGGP